MASFSEARENPVEQLWDEIDNVHAGMLGLMGGNMHMQPMAPSSDPKTNTVWFFTKTDSELARGVRPGSRAHFRREGRNEPARHVRPAEAFFQRQAFRHFEHGFEAD